MNNEDNLPMLHIHRSKKNRTTASDDELPSLTIQRTSKSSHEETIMDESKCSNAVLTSTPGNSESYDVTCSACGTVNVITDADQGLTVKGSPAHLDSNGKGW
jgi:hypothetical protein